MNVAAVYRHCSVDIETYSDIDIKKAGLYKYARSPEFRVLLIAYAVDNGPVQIIDLTMDAGAEGAGTNTVHWQEFLARWHDPFTIMHSYNAAFEAAALNIFMGHQGIAPIPLSRWRCTMAHGLYCGYTAGLAATGEAMGLPQDKRKLGIGQALIRKFCVPQKGTKTRPGPFRIMPAEEPEKWELFKAYCKQDVETEREIERRLSRWPMPEREQKLWVLTTEANELGVGVDMDMVHGALDLADAEQRKLETEAREISGLQNPKSVQQLMKWLNEELNTDEENEVKDLRKATVSDLLAAGVDSDKATRMLELRQLMSKTSTKKYNAIEAAVCSDERVRGMMFYYGANRTGRYAGRIIQPQNLPQNHLVNLDFARECVKKHDAEMIKVCWGAIPDVLSQLIRTAFVPSPGKIYAVADYSAIEARVVAWLAGEEAVLKAFREGKDIYCEMASQMFGVPVEKHGQNADLRQKGKVAILACIAEGQPVLTDRGLVPIEQVKITDRLWDGESWVHHSGVIYKGEREVITYEGLTATPDHLVWVEGQPEPVQFGITAASGAHLVRSGNGRTPIRAGTDYQLREAMEHNIQPLPCADPMSGMRGDTMDDPGQSTAGRLQGMPGLLASEADPEMAGQAADRGEAAVRESERPEFQPIRGTGNSIRLPEYSGCGIVPDPNIRCSGPGNGTGPDRQQRELCSGKYQAGNSERKRSKPGDYSAERVLPAVLALCRDSGSKEAGYRNDPGRDHSGRGTGCSDEAKVLEADKRTARLYDIRDAGPHHRFTVSGRLVHNCGYGGGESALIAMGALKMGLTEDELPEIKQKWRQANPAICRLWNIVEAKAIATVETGRPQVLSLKQYDPERARQNESLMGADPGSYSNWFRTGVDLAVFRREVDQATGQDFLTIQLPTGRKLFYAHPHLSPAKNIPDKQSLHYYGTEQATKKWGTVDTWGGKLCENLTQSVARDCLAETLIRLREIGLVAAFSVHDEVIVEVDKEEQLQDILDIMARPLDWAPGLPLKGAGFTCAYYQKD